MRAVSFGSVDWGNKLVWIKWKKQVKETLGAKQPTLDFWSVTTRKLEIVLGCSGDPKRVIVFFLSTTWHPKKGFSFRLSLYIQKRSGETKNRTFMDFFWKMWIPFLYFLTFWKVFSSDFAPYKVGQPSVWQRPAGPLWQTKAKTSIVQTSQLFWICKTPRNAFSGFKSVSEAGIFSVSPAKPLMSQVARLRSISVIRCH